MTGVSSRKRAQAPSQPIAREVNLPEWARGAVSSRRTIFYVFAAQETLPLGKLQCISALLFCCQVLAFFLVLVLYHFAYDLSGESKRFEEVHPGLLKPLTRFTTVSHHLAR